MTTRDPVDTTGDERHMRRALQLAERGRATSRPNPAVGCVIVADGEVVGEGWHRRAGSVHAEIAALEAAGSAAGDATAYVTLEPCGHHGRTPPCVDALIEADVARIVYGAADPVHGGAGRLRAAGIVVESGVCERAVRVQNEVFFRVAESGRPHVTVKLAQTVDGRAAAGDGSSRWITSRQARAAGHELRASADAVLVGSGTVLSDDPRLDVRHVPAPLGQPRPVVVDARGRIPPASAIVRAGSIVMTTSGSSSAWRQRIEKVGSEVVIVGPGAPTASATEPGSDITSDSTSGPATRTGSTGVDLHASLLRLLERDVHAVLVEGGPTVAAGLLRRDLVDRLVVFVAPALLGTGGIASVGALDVATVGDRRRFQFDEISRVGPDIKLVARPRGDRKDGGSGAAGRSHPG